MDVISLCLPIIGKLTDSIPTYHSIYNSDFIVIKYLLMRSSHNIWNYIWKHSLHVYAYVYFQDFNMPTSLFSKGLFSYVYSREYEAIRYLHLSLEDTSSSYDFIAYMTLYDIHSRQNNLTGMAESLADIHKLDFQQINITCYNYYAGFEDPHVTTAILFLQQVNETKLADKLRSKLFAATYAKMGCCDLEPHMNLLNSLYIRLRCVGNTY